MRALSKINVDEGMPWVELLPRVLRHLHDIPGVSGISPYEIVSGRHRPVAGLPYHPERESEDALHFLDRMAAQDKAVAKALY